MRSPSRERKFEKTITATNREDLQISVVFTYFVDCHVISSFRGV